LNEGIQTNNDEDYRRMRGAEVSLFDPQQSLTGHDIIG
jgi:hypothetical protein